MKRILVHAGLLMLLAANAFAAGKDPEFKMVDGKVSIQAEAITLKQFLQYWDAATGMTSKVNPQLANEKISVRLDSLEVNAAIRKSFQGQPWNWAVVNGKGINVIDRATAVSSATGGVSTSSIPSYIDTRNDPLPPQPQNNAPFAQAGGPVPAPVSGTPANQPVGATNLPPAQGGPAPPTQIFQPLGQSLGAPLPTVQPGQPGR